MTPWQCSECSVENRETGRFCAYCGSLRNAAAPSRRSEPIPETAVPEPMYFTREQNLRAWDVLRGVLDGEISETQAHCVIDAIEHQG